MRNTFTCIYKLLVISVTPLSQEHRDLPIQRREEAIAIYVWDHSGKSAKVTSAAGGGKLGKHVMLTFETGGGREGEEGRRAREKKKKNLT